MNQQDFENKLTEIANWSYRNPDPILEPVIEYDEDEDEYWIEQEVIPQRGSKLIDMEIKRPKKPCEDCNKEVRNREVLIKLVNQPLNHKRIKCKNCNKYKNPWTGEFNVPHDISHELFVHWCRNIKIESDDMRPCKFTPFTKPGFDPD